MNRNIVVLKGSPRPQGNTNALLAEALPEWKAMGCEVTCFDLYGMDIRPCLACRGCQADHTKVGCVQQDDMQKIFEAVSRADLLVIASPIYSWYCTPPTKAALDRMVYGFNKYYGAVMGPALWQGKAMALITTCGYPVEKGADLWEEGMKRYCRHSRLRYVGMLAERHKSYTLPFMNDGMAARARAFARMVAEA